MTPSATRRPATCALATVALAAVTALPFAASAMEASPWGALLAWGSVTVAVTAWLLAVATGSRAALTPLTRLEATCIALLLGLAAASALANPAPAVGIRRAAPFALVLLLLPAARWAVAERKRGAARLVLGAVVGAGTASALMAVLQAAWWLRLDDQGRATALFLNPNHLAGLVDLALPLAVAGALLGRRLRAPLGGAAALLLVAQGLTYSRAGWSVAVVALLVLAVAWAASARGWARARRWTALALALVAVVGLAVVLVALSPRTRGDLQTRLTDVAALQSDPSAELRPLLARKALRVVAAHPVLGVGYGAFGDAVVRYRGDRAQSALERDLRASIDHAHDDLLTVAAELGPLAALAMLALVVSLVVRSARGAPSAAWRWGAATALAALAVHGLVDGLLSRAAPVLPIWLVLAAAATAGTRRRIAAESVTPPTPPPGYRAGGRHRATGEG